MRPRRASFLQHVAPVAPEAGNAALTVLRDDGLVAARLPVLTTITTCWRNNQELGTSPGANEEMSGGCCPDVRSPIYCIAVARNVADHGEPYVASSLGGSVGSLQPWKAKCTQLNSYLW